MSATLAQVARGRPVQLVLGMLANKDARGLLAPFAKHAARLHAVQVPVHEHHPPARLADAAQGLGINVRFYKTLAFAICAFYGAVAGSLYAHLVRFISPESFEGTQSTLFITTLLLGGLQSDYGALIGSLVILPMKEMLQQFADYQGIAFALLSIMALFFFPRGLYGLIGQLRGLAGKRLRGKPAAAAPGTEAGAAGPRGRER